MADEGFLFAGWPDRIASASVVAAQAVGHPASNMQNTRLDKKWISSGLNWDDTAITVSYGQPRSIRTISLVGHNFSPWATIRYRGSSSEAVAIDLTDEVIVSVVSSSNLTGATLANLDEKVFDGSNTWATKTTIGPTMIHVSFAYSSSPTPLNPLPLSHCLRAKVRLSGSGPGNRYRMELWEAGVKIRDLDHRSPDYVTSTDYQIIWAPFSEDELVDPDHIELKIVDLGEDEEPASGRGIEYEGFDVVWDIADPTNYAVDTGHQDTWPASSIVNWGDASVQDVIANISAVASLIIPSEDAADHLYGSIEIRDFSNTDGYVSVAHLRGGPGWLVGTLQDSGTGMELGGKIGTRSLHEEDRTDGGGLVHRQIRVLRTLQGTFTGIDQAEAAVNKLLLMDLGLGMAPGVVVIPRVESTDVLQVLSFFARQAGLNPIQFDEQGDLVTFSVDLEEV